MLKNRPPNKAALASAILVWIASPIIAQEIVPDPRDWVQVAQVAGKTSAQTAVADDKKGKEPEDAARLETIIVTAQKRHEDLQNVPVSVQVVSGQTLAEQNYNTLEQVTEIVPDVHIAAGQESNQLFIRGVGSGDNA